MTRVASRTRRALLPLVTLLVALGAAVTDARAHGLEPALLSLRETAPGVSAVT